jgi:hypothetical protein
MFPASSALLLLLDPPPGAGASPTLGLPLTETFTGQAGALHGSTADTGHAAQSLLGSATRDGTQVVLDNLGLHVWDVGDSEHDFSVDLLHPTANQFAVWRGLDDANHMLAGFISGGSTVFRVYKSVNGEYTPLPSIAAWVDVGTHTGRVRVVPRGSTHEIYLDGVLRYTIDDPTLATGTLVGISGNTGATFDSINAVAAAVAPFIGWVEGRITVDPIGGAHFAESGARFVELSDLTNGRDGEDLASADVTSATCSVFDRGSSTPLTGADALAMTRATSPLAFYVPLPAALAPTRRTVDVRVRVTVSDGTYFDLWKRSVPVGKVVASTD